MTPEEKDVVLAKFLMELDRRYRESIKDKKFIINQPQYEKYQKAIEYMKKLVIEYNGEIVPIDNIEPTETNGFFQIKIDIFDLKRDQKVEFIEFIKNIDVFDIEPTLDGSLLFDINVNDVLKIVD
jgi:hypothetical protein